MMKLEEIINNYTNLVAIEAKTYCPSYEEMKEVLDFHNISQKEFETYIMEVGRKLERDGYLIEFPPSNGSSSSLWKQRHNDNRKYFICDLYEIFPYPYRNTGWDGVICLDFGYYENTESALYIFISNGEIVGGREIELYEDESSYLYEDKEISKVKAMEYFIYYSFDPVFNGCRLGMSKVVGL